MIPKFTVRLVQNRLQVIWHEWEFPQLIDEYVLQQMARNAYEFRKLGSYERDIITILDGLIKRGFLWRLRNRWMCQPDLEDELIGLRSGDLDEDFIF